MPQPDENVNTVITYDHSADPKLYFKRFQKDMALTYRNEFNFIQGTFN